MSKKRFKGVVAKLSSEDIVSVYDGDTFRCNINDWPEVFGKNISVRIDRVDTPEIRGKCPEEKKLAKKGRKLLKKFFREAKEIRLSEIRRCKYFRLIADVSVDDKDVTKMLIDAGVAVQYGGGKRKKWCK